MWWLLALGVGLLIGAAASGPSGSPALKPPAPDPPLPPRPAPPGPLPSPPQIDAVALPCLAGVVLLGADAVFTAQHLLDARWAIGLAFAVLTACVVTGAVIRRRQWHRWKQNTVRRRAAYEA